MLKKKIAYLLATISMFNVGITAFAVDTCNLQFDFNNDELSGIVECTFCDSVTYDVKTLTAVITDGKATLKVDDTSTYYIMDYIVKNDNGAVLLQNEGYAVSDLPSEMNINCAIESTEAYEGIAVEDRINQYADMMGISYEEAKKAFDDFEKEKDPGVVDKNTGSTTEKPDNGTEVTNNTQDNTQGNTDKQETFQTVTCMLMFGDIINVYKPDYVTISHNGKTDTIAVNENYEFDYTFGDGKYTIRYKGYQPITINCDNVITTKLFIIPERVLHLKKSTDKLNINIDGYDWSGELNNGVRSFAIMPEDEVIIDDIDGKKYRLAITSGVHEYTLNLDEGNVNMTAMETPIQDVTNDNPFGIPQTSERGIDFKSLISVILVMFGYITTTILKLREAGSKHE